MKPGLQLVTTRIITIWGYTAETHLNKVQRIMNKAVRIIAGDFDYDARGVGLLKQLFKQLF